MVGVSLKTIIRSAVEGCILCSTKVANGNSLRVILSLQVRSILESAPIFALPRGLQNILTTGRANQADVSYCIDLQADMGVNMGMYNGVQSPRHGHPYELTRGSIRKFFWVIMK